MASATVEDYVKHIYVLSEKTEGDEVPMGQVAEALGVVPGTATTMMKALADADLVKYSPRVGVQLTSAGEKLALHVLRRHRLLEQFLVEVLGFDWSEVHEEAEQLEHVVSERLLERIDLHLGHPTEDPHGDPIPSALGELSQRSAQSLADCISGMRFEVERVSDQDKAFLRYVSEVGLGPGVFAHVVSVNTVAETVDVTLDSRNGEISLGIGAARKIMVRPHLDDDA